MTLTIDYNYANLAQNIYVKIISVTLIVNSNVYEYFFESSLYKKIGLISKFVYWEFTGFMCDW